MRLVYTDDRDNVFWVRYGATTPGNCKVVEFSVQRPKLQRPGNVGSASITVRRVGDRAR